MECIKFKIVNLKSYNSLIKIILCLLLSYLANGLLAQTQEIILPASNSGRLNIPLYVTTKELSPSVDYFYLQHKARKEFILAQKVDNNTIVFIPRQKISINKKFRYKLLEIPVQKVLRKPVQPVVRFQQTEKGIEAWVKEKLVFIYHTKLSLPPSDSPLYYKRSGFIHPLFSPSGDILTDDFPAGHAHQHAIFTAWPNTSFRNAKVDFWNQHQQSGTVTHDQVLELTSGEIFGRMRVKLFHQSLKDGNVLEEIWTITLYAIEQDFLFDLESDQKNITLDTLYLHQYIYGGLAFRGSREWNKHNPGHKGDSMHILTSEGRMNRDANHTLARFVTAYGTVQELVGGVTIFDHAQNFRYPQPIRVHPEMPYWAYSPVVSGGFTIDPGKTYTSRYRYFSFTGLPDKKRIKEIEREWAGRKL